MDAATYGAGPHGYDYQIGTWTCANPAPSPISGPAHQTMTVTKVSDGVLLFRTTGTNYDFTSNNIYVSAKNRWTNPYSGSDGSYGDESTSQTGSKTVWVGSTYFPKMGKMVQTRDTYVNSASKYTDLGEYSLNAATTQ